MSTPRRILALAFDQDEASSKSAVQTLTQAGLECRVVKDPSAVMGQVSSFKPELILLERPVPGTPSGQVVDLLDGTGVPLVFLLAESNGRELVHALQAHAVEVIPRAFGPEHAARLAGLLDELAGRPRDESITWEDEIARNLVELARRHKLQGTLVVNQGTPFEGRVVFKEGALVRAAYGPLTGMDAVREILMLEDGVYELDAALEPPTRKVAHSATQLEPGQAPTLGAMDNANVRPRLLAVDDQPEMLTLSSKHLSRAGFEVSVAEDGAAAVEAARKTPFDLIVADLNMPRMDGWEMLKTLKADHRTSEVPVIFLSAHDDLRETLRAARAGAHDYLAKTGRWDVIVSSALKTITPRLEALFHLLVNEPVEVRTQVLGLQWTLRTLARLKATGVLELKDDYGSYRLDVHEGQPASVQAKVQQRTILGLPAFARMMVATSAKGLFTPGPVQDGTGSAAPLTFSMEELISRTCEGLNAVESKGADQRLAAAAVRYEVDPELYGLFCRIAPPRKVAFAQSVCERKLGLADLATVLKISLEQAVEWFNELLRRGVIKPEAKFELLTPMPQPPATRSSQ